MKSQAWKIAGMALAVTGSLAMAQEAGDADTAPQVKKQKPNQEEMLKRFDVDGDGQLSEAEKAAMQQAMQGRHGRGQPGGPQGERPGREEMMKRFDADGDGVLSETEREAMRAERDLRRKEHMERFDADGDGRLSEEERATMRETLRAERPAPPEDKVEVE